jgi:hypothetical protein
MTSKATTIKLIDAALLAKYSGLTVLTGDPPASTPVSVFLETPDPEERTERTYPSISIQYVTMAPDYRDMQHCDDEDDEDLILDGTVTPPEMITRPYPTAFRIMYSLGTWHRKRIAEDRDLVFEALLRTTKIRSYLTVPNIDGTNITVWLMWDGGVVNADADDVDERIYHKSLTLTVLAYLALVEDTDTTRSKVVTNIEFEVDSYKDGVSTKDVAFEFDSTGVRRLDD